MSIEKLVHNFTNAEKLPFTILANAVIQNLQDAEVLSVWVYLSSMPTDWIVNRKQLMSHFKIGERKINKIMYDLKQLNLLEYIQYKDSGGKFAGMTARILNGSKFGLTEPKSTGHAVSVGTVSAPTVLAVHTNKDTYKENIKTNNCEVASQTSPALVNQEKTNAIFEHWKAVMDHPRAKLDLNRKAFIQKALKLGYPPEQLCQAIDGCKKTPHNMGKNDRNQIYDGLHVIFRDADHIERFSRMANSGKQLSLDLEKKKELKKQEEENMRKAQEEIERKRAHLEQAKWSDEYKNAMRPDPKRPWVANLPLAMQIEKEGRKYRVEFREPIKRLNASPEPLTKWLPYKD